MTFLESAFCFSWPMGFVPLAKNPFFTPLYKIKASVTCTTYISNFALRISPVSSYAMCILKAFLSE